MAALQTLHWHLSAPFKDVLEQAIERFDGLGAQRVEEASNLHAVRSGTRAGWQDTRAANAAAPPVEKPSYCGDTPA